tara:strand:+ start:5939 stop:8050 length:2112 start_codon:yes stop_codon:yes gene_type:complete
MDKLLQKFNDIKLEVDSRSSEEESEQTPLNSFLEYMLEILEQEARILPNPIVEYTESKEGHIRAFAIDEEEKRLDIFDGKYLSGNKIENIPKSDIDKSQKTLRKFLYDFESEDISFFDKSNKKKSIIMKSLKKSISDISMINIFFITNGTTRLAQNMFEEDNFNEAKVRYQVWDLEKINTFTSDKQQAEININFDRDYDQNFSCIQIDNIEANMKAYIGIIPGYVVADIYRKYHRDILELNVRSFLSARGNVNKGLKATIAEDPDRFIAYNNGITATATDIKTNHNGDFMNIISAKNFQIVNGGQTTVSLYNHLLSSSDQGESLKKISVPIKILDLSKMPMIDEEVKLISQFSNTQNKVNKTDFYASDPFHIEIEKLSRNTTFIVNNVPVRWFYERKRGSFDVERNMGSYSEQSKFDKIYPKKSSGDNISHVFSKSELGRTELAFGVQPDVASKGGDAAFTRFVDALSNNEFTPSDNYYKDLIAKLTFWRRMEKIVHKNHARHSTPQIVSYSIASFVYLNQSRINFTKIVEDGKINEILASYNSAYDSFEGHIPKIISYVREFLTSYSELEDIMLYARKVECWNSLKKFIDNGDFISKVGDTPADILQDRNSYTVKNQIDFTNKITDNMQKDIDSVSKEGADYWWAVASWAKENNKLSGIQRSMSANIAKQIKGKGVSYKLAKQGVRIRKEVKRMGFKFQEKL